MLDEKGKAMTIPTWQDKHSGYRRHKLMTKELGVKIPAIGANEDVDDYDDVLVQAKLFSPYTGWRWYITEWDPETGTCFGLVEGFETEPWILPPHRACGINRARKRSRRGARPVLGAEDHRRDQETVAMRREAQVRPSRTRPE